MPGENPPVGPPKAQERRGEAHYALTGLPNTIMASEYKVQLPDEIPQTNLFVRNHAGNSAFTRGGSLDNGEKR